MYYIFTSLSTVGFGDMAPIGDRERMLGAFIFFSGVITFTEICGIFTGILNSFITLNEDLDNGDKLSGLFNLLSSNYYNDGLPFDFELQTRIEEYFAYKW
jgi:hypothetical protein